MMGTKNFDNALDLITFSRTSGGTALRKISYGSELVTNGTFDTDVSGWTAGAGMTLTAVDGDLRIQRGANINQNNYTSFSTTAGGVYQVSWQYKGRSPASTHYTDFRVGSSIGGVDYYRAVDSSSSEFSQDIRTGVFVASGTTSYVTAVLRDGVSGDYIAIDNISVKEVLFDQPDGTLTLFNHPAQIPRIEYAADGTVKGLLVEEARTNSFLQSEDLTDAAWSSIRALVSSNGDGSFTLTQNASDFVGAIIQTVSFAGGEPATISWEVKAGTADWVFIRESGFAGLTRNTWFNVATGSVGILGSGHTASIEPRGDGWYRLSISGVNDGTARTAPVQLFLTQGDGAVASSVDFNGSTILMRRPQFEQGSFPTSYIPTSGSTVTRAADVASIPVSAFGYNQTAGTVVVEWRAAGGLADPNPQFLIGTGSGSARWAYHNSTGIFQTWDGATAVQVVNSAADGIVYKSAISTNQSVVSTATNGASFATNIATTGNIASLTNKFQIGASHVLGDQLNGHIRSIQYYPRRLSNAQLQELTS